MINYRAGFFKDIHICDGQKNALGSSTFNIEILCNRGNRNSYLVDPFAKIFKDKKKKVIKKDMYVYDQICTKQFGQRLNLTTLA